MTKTNLIHFHSATRHAYSWQ